MQEAQNTKIVQDAYDAFGRGDVQTLLGYFDEAILWKPVHGAARHVPTAGERRGKAAVGEFFKIVSEQVNFLRFEPKEFVAQGDKVVAIGHYVAQGAHRTRLRIGLRDGVHAARRQGGPVPGVQRQRRDQRRLRQRGVRTAGDHRAQSTIKLQHVTAPSALAISLTSTSTTRIPRSSIRARVRGNVSG